MTGGGRALAWAALAALTFLAAGCTTELGEVSGLLGAEAYPPAMVLATGAVGEDCGSSLLFMRGSEPRLESAVARAIATVPDATLLTDVRVERAAITTGLYNRSCLHVHGSAAKLIRQLVLPAPPGHHDAHPGPPH